MECGSPPDSRVMRRRRVLSPSAAKSAAGVERGECGRSAHPAPIPRPRRLACLLRILRDIFVDVDHLLAPAFAILEERERPARSGDFVEARLDDFWERALRRFLQMKFDEGHWFARIVLIRVDRIGMPLEREAALRFDFLDP